jgi:hypothetical protein
MFKEASDDDKKFLWFWLTLFGVLFGGAVVGVRALASLV